MSVATPRKFHPETVSSLIDQYGHSSEEVADFIKMSPASLAKALGGDKVPTYRQLKALADLYNVRAVEFFSPKLPTSDAGVVDFRDAKRAKIDLPPDVLSSINFARDQAENIEEIAQFLQLPVSASKFIEEFKVTEQNLMSSQHATRVRGGLGFDIDNVSALVANGKRGLAEFYLRLALANASISVTIGKIPSDDFTGFYLHRENVPSVFVDTKKHSNSRPFTIAHELGHALTGEESGGSNTALQKNTIERACNVFAANFLVSDRIIALADTAATEDAKVTRLFRNSLLSRQASAVALRSADKISATTLEKYFSNVSHQQRSGGGGPPDYHGIQGFTFTHLNKAGILGSLVVSKAFEQAAIPASLAGRVLGFDVKYLDEVLRLIKQRIHDLDNNGVNVGGFSLVNRLIS